MPKAANFIPNGFHTITPRRANEHFAKTAAASR